MTPHYTDPLVTLYLGDCLDVMRELPDASVDSVVTDPPYGLEFMGKSWDSFKATGNFGGGGKGDAAAFNAGSSDPKKRGNNSPLAGRPRFNITEPHAYQTWCEQWATEAFRVLKPGGYLLAFGGSRTYHRLASAIEDAGFEIRDTLMWIYASGFPKSLDVSKALDKVAGAEREVVGSYRVGGNALTPTSEKGGTYGVGVPNSPAGELSITAPSTELAKRYDGFGTALKPAHEPIVMARKPLIGTVVSNVTRYGTGAINIGATRIGTSKDAPASPAKAHQGFEGKSFAMPDRSRETSAFNTNIGRWPSNVLLSDPELFDEPNPWVVGSGATATSGELKPYTENHNNPTSYGFQRDKTYTSPPDSGGYSRFFIVPKSDRQERERGLDRLYCNCKTVKPEQWERQDRKQPARTATTSRGKATSEASTRADSDSSMTLFGSSTSDPSNQETRSTTSTGTSSTTESRTSSPSIPSPTSDSTPGASSSTASGGSDAPPAPSTDPSTTSGGTSRGKAGRSTADAAPATSSGSSATSNCAECGRVVKPQSGRPVEAADGVAGARRNSHPT